MSSMHHKMRRITQLLNNRYSGVHRHGGDRPNPFKTLISCVLSQRTRDVNAERAAEALFTAAERPEDILKLGQERLRSLIRCSGFYNQKSRYIIGICEALIGEFDGHVPEERDELLRLPGVGHKTADVVLSHAFDRPAIAVDVHVATVAKRLGLVEEDAGSGEAKEALEAMVPPEERRLVDGAFVRLGKEYCRTRAPRCMDCLLKILCDYQKPRDNVRR